MEKYNKIYNLSRHNHALYENEWKQLGFIFVPSTKSQLLPVSYLDSITSIEEKCNAMVNNALKAGADTILINGLASVVYYVCVNANRKLKVVEPVFSGRAQDNSLIFTNIRYIVGMIGD